MASNRLNRIKQALQVLMLGVLFLTSAAILKDYIREQIFLWPAREEGAGLHLLFESRAWIFRRSPADGGKIGWWFSSTGDPPEGSTGMFRIPSWPLVLVAIGVLVITPIIGFNPEGRRGKDRPNR